MYKRQCERFGKSMCDFLEKRLGSTSGKGLTIMQTFNFRKKVDGPTYVIYKTSSSDRGTIVNFCPFCGGKLYEEQSSVTRLLQREGA